MDKKKHLFMPFFLLHIIFVFTLLTMVCKKKISEWTPDNSLVQVSAPILIDQKGCNSLIHAINLSLKYLAKNDPRTLIQLGPDTFTITQLKITLIDFKNKLMKYGLSDQFFQYIKKNFIFYKTSAKNVIFTGYYEASLKGSLTKSDTYRFPLYRKPDDLIKIDLSRFYFFSKFKGLPIILKGRFNDNQMILPYYSRQEIDSQQKLTGKNLEIVWTDDFVEVFFLHIQGSGVITLNTGKTIRVNYEESNGHPYRAIGRVLIERGKLDYENLSMQSIKKYLKNHPEEIEEIFNSNPSYVFFKKIREGPLGSIEVPLTPYRSIATDKNLFPQGALCYIKTEIPDYERSKTSQDLEVKKWKKYHGFVLNQDSGGAIRSPGRIDIFTGYGKKSEWIAGHMKQNGTFYFLIKK